MGWRPLRATGSSPRTGCGMCAPEMGRGRQRTSNPLRFSSACTAGPPVDRECICAWLTACSRPQTKDFVARHCAIAISLTERAGSVAKCTHLAGRHPIRARAAHLAPLLQSARLVRGRQAARVARAAARSRPSSESGHAAPALQEVRAPCVADEEPQPRSAFRRS